MLSDWSYFGIKPSHLVLYVGLGRFSVWFQAGSLYELPPLHVFYKHLLITVCCLHLQEGVEMFGSEVLFGQMQAKRRTGLVDRDDEKSNHIESGLVFAMLLIISKFWNQLDPTDPLMTQL